MDLATPTHLKALRSAIVDRLDELRAGLDEARRAQLALAAEPAPEVGDRKDAARQFQDARLVDASVRREADEAALYEAALQRLDAGHYGDCEECGEPIALQRLRVQPAALRCAACQARHE